MSSHPPVFIVGTGRCGSTLMSNLVRMHPQILSLSEVFVSFATEGFPHRHMDGERFWRLLNEASPVLRKAINPVRSPVEFTYPFADDSPWDMQSLPACLYMTLPHLSDAPDSLYHEMEPVVRARPNAPMHEQYRFWFDWLATRHDKAMWIERSGNSITMVKALLRLFPDAKFVHIHRDGRETAMSIRNFMPLRVFLHMWKRLRLVGIDLLRTPFRYSDSVLVNTFAPVFSAVMPVEQFLDTEPTAAEAGAFWSAMIVQGMKDLAQVPAGNLHNISYTDLVERPEATLTAFADFAAPGLDHQNWIKQAAGIPKKSRAKWRDLPEIEQRTLESAVAPGMQLLGYEL